MTISYSDHKKENWFLVSWTLSNKCNYKCSYCSDILHNGSTGHPDWAVVSQFINNFKIPEKEICFRISGGEPTYWKHFIELAKLIKSHGYTFSFLTNGSQTIEYFSKINPYTDGMIISYHPEYADVDHIIEIAKVMDCTVAINLMMVPEKFEQLLLIAEKLFNGSTNITVWPKVILDKTSITEYITNNVNDYTKEQLDTFKKWPYFKKVKDNNLHRGNILLDGKPITANDLLLDNKTNHKGWKCWGGLHMLSIDMWGNIYRSECKQGGLLGNIKEYQLPKDPIICNSNKCVCLSDIYLRKDSV